jgi:hypothetical protein
MNTVSIASDEKIIDAEKHVYLCKSPSSLQAPADKVEDVTSFTVLDQPPIGLTPTPLAPHISDRYWSIVCVKSITKASVDGCGIASAPPGQLPNPTPAPTVTPTQRR